MALEDTMRSLREFDINDLDFDNVGSWPYPIKLFIWVLLLAAVAAFGWGIVQGVWTWSVGGFALVLLALILCFNISDRVLGIMANPFYLDLGFTHLIVDIPSPFDHETIERLPRLRELVASG